MENNNNNDNDDQIIRKYNDYTKLKIDCKICNCKIILNRMNKHNLTKKHIKNLQLQN
jgi:hypothetical protein